MFEVYSQQLKKSAIFCVMLLCWLQWLVLAASWTVLSWLAMH